MTSLELHHLQKTDFKIRSNVHVLELDYSSQGDITQRKVAPCPLVFFFFQKKKKKVPPGSYGIKLQERV